MIFNMNTEDFIFITVVLLLILSSIIILLLLKNREKYMDTVNKAK